MLNRFAAIAFAVFAFLVFLFFLWSTIIPYFENNNPIPLFLREAGVSVWRDADCGNCTEPFDNQIISKYPKLQDAMQQMDQKFMGKFSKVCDTTDDKCLDQFRAESVYFKMRADKAAQMSGDLEGSGANVEGVCFEGGCHSLGFNIGNATYTVWFSFR